MTGISIPPGESGELVLGFEYDPALPAAIKQLPGHLLANPAVRPPHVQQTYIAVNPEASDATSLSRKPRAPSIVGHSRPLSAHRSHSLSKQVQDESAVREMAHAREKRTASICGSDRQKRRSKHHGNF